MPSSAGGSFELLGTPQLVWDAYVTYLVKYESGSWVATAATAFRVFAVLLMLPIMFLTLLDITSYVIARTLGVVDESKAATSDKPSIPAIRISPADAPLQQHPTDSVSASTSGSSFSLISHSDSQPGSSTAARPSGAAGAQGSAAVAAGTKEDRAAEHPEAYFATDDTAPLSGVGVFSPAASQPPSPVLTRPRLERVSSAESVATTGTGTGSESQDEGAPTVRRRAPAGLTMTARDDA